MRNRKLKLPAAAAALLWAGSVAGGGDQGPEDIKEFVRQVYVHGIPFEQASRYGASAVPALVEMLQDPEEQAHWSNIVITLGMIGDKSAVEPLLEFLDGGEATGTPSRSRVRAEKSALMSLGYLIHQCESQKALEYLTARMAPPVLPALTSLAATDPAAATPPGGNLSKYAVLGLALSGHPKAAEALQAFRDREPEPVVTEPSAWAALTTRLGVGTPGTGVGDTLRSQIGEALSAHGEIADKGLAEYYRASSP